MQNPLKRRFICMTMFFFFLLLAIFLKVQLQYSAIWENCSNRSTQAWASPSYPSYTSFTVYVALLSCFPGWKNGSSWVAASKQPIWAAFMSFYFPINPRKGEATNRLCFFHGECQVHRGTKASRDSTAWEFLVQKCILHFQVPKFREMQKVKTHYL